MQILGPVKVELGRNEMNLLRKISFSLERLSLPAAVITEFTECPEEHLTHSEDTLFKVQAAIMSCDLGEDDVRDVINAIHNAGILFRERSD